MNKYNMPIKKTLSLIILFIVNQFEMIFSIIILYITLTILDYLSEILVEKKKTIECLDYKKK